MSMNLFMCCSVHVLLFARVYVLVPKQFMSCCLRVCLCACSCGVNEQHELVHELVHEHEHELVHVLFSSYAVVCACVYVLVPKQFMCCCLRVSMCLF